MNAKPGRERRGGFGSAWIITLAMVLAASAVDAARTPTRERGVLWQLERGNGPASYLYGTIHSEDARVLDLPEAVTRPLEGASVFLIEADLGAGMELAALRRMMLVDGRRLSDLLSPESLKRVEAAMVAKGFPPGTTAYLKPWAVSIMLSVPRPETGVFLDLRLRSLAREHGIPVEGVETIAEQLDVLDGLSEADQLVMLEETLAHLGELDDMYEQLVEAWLDRDLGEIRRLGQQELAGRPETAERVFDRLIVRRNHRMAERIVPFLEKGNVFVAVGALHLPGDDGILSLLEKRGFRVRALY